MLGTRGVPASYGGFETAVEEIGWRLVEAGHDVTVFCRNGNGLSTYRGMELVHLPALRRRSLETLSHTALSVAHPKARGSDVCFLFNAANAPFLPWLRSQRVPVAVHVDGLEWQRGKWGPVGKRFYRMSERLAVRWADAIIADAIGISDYYAKQYGAESRLIAYGAPIVDPPSERLQEIDLDGGGYHLLVARFEPENHVDVVLEGYSRSTSAFPMIVVGSVPYETAHSRAIRAIADRDSRIRLIGPIWDQELLDSLYGGAVSYWHGHSVGGTNPSLLRAMGAGAPVAAFDVSFNREVMGPSTGLFWRSVQDVPAVLAALEVDPERTREMGQAGRLRVAARYRWEDVAREYELLAEELVAGSINSGDTREVAYVDEAVATRVRQADPLGRARE
jgi:glycosyltransferase involved in cell wall biosynthesis